MPSPAASQPHPDKVDNGPAPQGKAVADRLRVGATFPPLSLTATDGRRVEVPSGDTLVHLQFRRFAGCPICNLHLHSFVRRHRELGAAGVQEVVFFHSGRDALLRHAADLPFPVVPDPERRFYRAFGVESGARALADPRAWPALLQTLVTVAADILVRGRPLPPLRSQGGRLGLPADVLIDRTGRILAVKYGGHADDQWTVDTVLALAGGADRQGSPA
ncbi:MAG: peroxiredoxin-like family protein [Sneathiellaceae bacterium]